MMICIDYPWHSAVVMKPFSTTTPILSMWSIMETYDIYIISPKAKTGLIDWSQNEMFRLAIDPILLHANDRPVEKSPKCDPRRAI